MSTDVIGAPASPAERVGTARLDAAAKASGRTRYTADLPIEGLAHAAVARSTAAHGRIRAVRLDAAGAAPGVIGVFVAEDLATGLFGRRVRDMPVLATGKVRFMGEAVAAVVAERRDQAEAAAALVEIDIERLPGVFDATEALSPSSPLVHEAPWAYPGAVVAEADGPNLQSRVRHGDEAAVEEALARAALVVDEIYRTAAGHQGYLEPQACVARVSKDGAFEIWASDKSPYRVRQQLAETFSIDVESIVLHPVPIGGDFGGKGSPAIVPLCAALARATRRPVRLALRYAEDLVATNPRHPTSIRVRIGADDDGRLVGMRVDSIADGGAYASAKPIPSAGLHGLKTVGTPYRIPNVFIDSRIAYTNSVPKGHMRAPGSPQATFAFESALDELAVVAGLDAVEMRRRNLLANGEVNYHGIEFAEFRGAEVLDAALAALEPAAAPEGWASGWGIAVYDRETAANKTSLRLRAAPGGVVVAEVPMPETGTGSHTVVRDGLARLLDVDPSLVDVVQVSTAELPFDVGVGASRVTAGVSALLTEAARKWLDRGDDDVVLVEIDGEAPDRVTSCCVQIAQVAVDLGTGELKVLEVLTATDVAEVVHPAAHRMQIDGGAVMGFGFACIEDLLLDEGQVWAANLGEFRIPSIRDAPRLETVLVTGSRGLGALDVKSIGELSNVPTAAAIANAVARATGARVRELPLTAERIYDALSATTGATR